MEDTCYLKPCVKFSKVRFTTAETEKRTFMKLKGFQTFSPIIVQLLIFCKVHSFCSIFKTRELNNTMLFHLLFSRLLSRRETKEQCVCISLRGMLESYVKHIQQIIKSSPQSVRFCGQNASKSLLQTTEQRNPPISLIQGIGVA